MKKFCGFGASCDICKQVLDITFALDIKSVGNDVKLGGILKVIWRTWDL